MFMGLELGLAVGGVGKDLCVVSWERLDWRRELVRSTARGVCLGMAGMGVGAGCLLNLRAVSCCCAILE